MDTVGGILVLRQPSATAVRFEAANSFHYSRLETLNWEEEEPLKCEIKTEELIDADSRDSFDALNTDMKMSTSAVDKNNVKFILSEIKSETLDDDERQPGQDNIFIHHQIRKKHLTTIKCPGCIRIFSKNYWGLMDMSHHIMSSHRQNMRNYMFSIRMKYGRPQKSYNFRNRIKQQH